MSIDCGYCTNVYPGGSLEGLVQALGNHSRDLRKSLAHGQRLPIGLWFSRSLATELGVAGTCKRFFDFLGREQFAVQSLNGFPFGDFHQPVVKHSVYEPNWADPGRVEYTRNLIDILISLLDTRSHGTISTLPLGWPSADKERSFGEVCAKNLMDCAEYARQRCAETGKRIRVCLEPEPGCCLATSREAIAYFREYLFPLNHDLTTEHLGICHDVCHAFVMEESQAGAIEAYRANGIVIGKVQISSALVARFDPQRTELREATARELSKFEEPRYLHQTMVDGHLYDDLVLARQLAPLMGEWRVHFHLPIFVSDLGNGLLSSRPEIHACLDCLWSQRETIDWEIETYAWSVLPAELQPTSLCDGISAELDWFQKLASEFEIAQGSATKLDSGRPSG